MPDIAMCKGTGCTLKQSCYRYRAKPSFVQVYFSDPPLKNDNCKYYWEMTIGLEEEINGVLKLQKNRQ